MVRRRAIECAVQFVVRGSFTPGEDANAFLTIYKCKAPLANLVVIAGARELRILAVAPCCSKDSRRWLMFRSCDAVVKRGLRGVIHRKPGEGAGTTALGYASLGVHRQCLGFTCHVITWR